MAKGSQHAAKGYVLMDALRKGKEPSYTKVKATKAPKKAFTDAETEAIEHHFADHIEEGRTPCLGDCRAHVQLASSPNRSRDP